MSTYSQLCRKYNIGLTSLRRFLTEGKFKSRLIKVEHRSGRPTIDWDESQFSERLKLFADEVRSGRKEYNTNSFSVREYAVDGITDHEELKGLIGHRVRFVNMKGVEQFGVLVSIDGPVVVFDQNGMERVNLIFKSGIQKLENER